ncbi:MAG: hypothetical protein NTX17_05590 [Candidatus Eisenbacteria bacterium]|nr:hypothetical protein [Candidatus Eisenbacteria bacterium]
MEESKAGRNRIFARFKGGKLLKGYTHDFKPVAETFHLVDQGGVVHEIKCSDLKAVFFVKSFEGRKEYVEKKRFEEVDCTALRGLKIRLEFSDGEVIRGFSLGYSKDRKGFYITPLDPAGNNERMYVIADALRDVKVGSAAEK